MKASISKVVMAHLETLQPSVCFTMPPMRMRAKRVVRGLLKRTTGSSGFTTIALMQWQTAAVLR